MLKSTIYRTAAVAAVALGTVPFLGSAAEAQTCYPPTPDCATTTSSTPTTGPTLRLSATTVTRGQTISATVGGFTPGSSGILTIASVEQQIGSFTMPAAGGTTTTSITIPSSISLGAHTVFARGTVAGQPASASQGVIVVAGNGGGGTIITGGGGSGGSSLARTGATVGVVAVVGLGLVAGGEALKRSGKRRRARSAG